MRVTGRPRCQVVAAATERRDGRARTCELQHVTSRQITHGATIVLRVNIQLVDLAGLTTRIVGRDAPRSPRSCSTASARPATIWLGSRPTSRPGALRVSCGTDHAARHVRRRARLVAARPREAERSSAPANATSGGPRGARRGRVKLRGSSILQPTATRGPRRVLQGAMLALDVALHRETPARRRRRALRHDDRRARMDTTAAAAGRRAGVHVARPARSAAAVRDRRALRDRLVAAGAVVEWHAFDGAHGIPSAVVDALGWFLERRAQA